jgi:oligopeptide/dipeptide ABC transporter ATP-binding protein
MSADKERPVDKERPADGAHGTQSTYAPTALSALIDVRDLGRAFGARRRRIWAVDEVSFRIHERDILCLVGESGCGKTTTGKLVAGLLRPSTGEVRFESQDIWAMDKKTFKRYRTAVQMIHQDPYASLNPMHTVYDIITAPLFRHKLVSSRAHAWQRCIELFTIVGLTPPEDLLRKHPHELSGGQRQRVSVARALTVNPSLIVADEAVSMVDVSIRVSLLTMLGRLRDEFGVTFLFITHDLALAKYFAWGGRIAVMYVGSMVEVADTPRLVNDPLHPYTQALLAAVPEADPELTRSKKRIALRSQDIPSLLNLPAGCRFHPRCPRFVEGLCEMERPELFPTGDGREVACHVVARERGIA